MFGAQYETREVSEQEANAIQPWTEDQIHALVRAMFKNPHGQESRILALMHDSIFRPGLHTVARFLGDVPDISGGAIGTPCRPAMWMYLLRNKFEDHFLPQIHEIYMVPWSNNEKMIRALQIYFWTWVEYTSDCGIPHVLGSTAGSLTSSTAETPTTSPSSDVSTSDSHRELVQNDDGRAR